MKIGEHIFDGIRVYLTPYNLTKLFDKVATTRKSFFIGLLFKNDSVIIDRDIDTIKMIELFAGLEIVPDYNLNKEYYAYIEPL